ncbi:MAG: hypothetical protein K6E56_07600 [Lachnospiraceae bacterium]|nr:hypothetical protein [Lachnospiraceae bacterium]
MSKNTIDYDKFIDYQRTTHTKNQKRIKIGLKINILLPLVFLVVSFITKSSKLVFLMLWIISLFGIAFYLLYVEYSDYMMIERMKEFGVDINEANDSALIGEFAVAGENIVLEKIDEADGILQETKSKIEEKKLLIKEKLKDNEKHS